MEVKANEHQQKVDELRKTLLAGVPEDPAQRSAEQQALWLFAYLLDFHRREYLATVWEYWRLKELPEEDLFDERNAIVGLEFVKRVDTTLLSGNGRFISQPPILTIEQQAQFVACASVPNLIAHVGLSRAASTDTHRRQTDSDHNRSEQTDASNLRRSLRLSHAKCH